MTVTSYFRDLAWFEYVLFILGIIYGGKLVTWMVTSTYDALKAYVFPNIVSIFRQDNFVEKYGKWAVVTGCTQGIEIHFDYGLFSKAIIFTTIRNTFDVMKYT